MILPDAVVKTRSRTESPGAGLQIISQGRYINYCIIFLVQSCGVHILEFIAGYLKYPCKMIFDVGYLPGIDL